MIWKTKRTCLSCIVYTDMPDLIAGYGALCNDAILYGKGKALLFQNNIMTLHTQSTMETMQCMTPCIRLPAPIYPLSDLLMFLVRPRRCAQKFSCCRTARSSRNFFSQNEQDRNPSEFRSTRHGIKDSQCLSSSSKL